MHLAAFSALSSTICKQRENRAEQTRGPGNRGKTGVRGPRLRVVRAIRIRTEEFEFLDLADFRGVAFSVESIIDVHKCLPLIVRRSQKSARY